MKNEFSYILIVLGAWIIFDGLLSMLYFAWYIDHTFGNWQDQAVRIVRTAVGIAIILIAFVF
jgi:hypothetical protein